MLKIEHPIIQGGMHHVGYATLAAAVSNAGGLGTVTALTQRTPELLRAEIQACKALLKPGKPFAVNFTLLPSLAPPDYGSYAQVIVDEKVPVVETAGRNPGEWISFFKKHGITVVHKCVAIKHALTHFLQLIALVAALALGIVVVGIRGAHHTRVWFVQQHLQQIL